MKVSRLCFPSQRLSRRFLTASVGETIYARSTSVTPGRAATLRLYFGAAMHWNLILFTARWWAFIGTILTAAMSLGVTLSVTRAGWVRRTWRRWLQGLVLILLVFSAAFVGTFGDFARSSQSSDPGRSKRPRGCSARWSSWRSSTPTPSCADGLGGRCRPDTAHSGRSGACPGRSTSGL